MNIYFKSVWRVLRNYSIYEYYIKHLINNITVNEFREKGIHNIALIGFAKLKNIMRYKMEIIDLSSKKT